MGRYYDVEVVHTEMLTPHARRIDIRRADGEPFRFRPGQFLMMWFEHEGKRVNRSYSVASRLVPGEEVAELELCIALIDGGIGSQRVAEWDEGSVFTVSGPHGRFVLRDEAGTVVLVGTGTGIAPYRSMIPQIEERLEAGHDVYLVFGARTEGEFLYHDEWRALADKHDGFHYRACADAAVDPDGWAADGNVVGRVQHAIEAIELEDDAVFYLCGNPAMVDDVKAMLGERGFDLRSIRTEAYVSPTAP